MVERVALGVSVIDPVLISSRKGRKPCVKPLGSHSNLVESDVISAQCALNPFLEGIKIPQLGSFGYLHMAHLVESVDAGIGAPRHDRSD
jgi:hypothetical protein